MDDGVDRPKTPLDVIKQALKEEEEKELGVWTKEYKGLSPKDQKYLFKSGKKVLEKIVVDYPETLPDAIIFPDISARPLAHLLKPFIRELCLKRGVPVPDFLFFQPHKGPELKLVDENNNPQSMTSVEDLKKSLPSVGEDNSFLRSYIEDEITLREGGFSKAVESRGLMRKRANEIKNYLTQKGVQNPKIIVIDDYVTKQAETIGEIRLAFGNQLQAYVLLQEQGADHSSRGIFTGMDDPFLIEETTSSQGFGYRSKHAGNRHAIGAEVNPAGNTVRPAKHRNSTSLNNLYSDMTEVGNKIAESLLN